MAAQISRELADQGFHTQTIAACGQMEEDLQTVAAIREIVGNRIELRFDGQSRYEVDAACELAAEMELSDIQFLADPFRVHQWHSLASLGRQTSIPLAAWRPIHEPADALMALRTAGVPYLIVDLEQVGGILPARACAAVAAAGGVISILGSRPSVGIATAAMLHVAAATAAFSTANELSYQQLFDSMLTSSFDTVDGMIDVPQSIGLGVTIDRGKVEKFQQA
jgi:L-alanine-DL-glutamate epimerase-like enolase superfamily enzyme